MNLILYCTKKALAEFKISSAPVLEPFPGSPWWTSWYCNILKTGRQKWYLFTNAQILLSFMMMKGKIDPVKTLEGSFKFYLPDPRNLTGVSVSI
jgi:hypothetical protein